MDFPELEIIMIWELGTINPIDGRQMCVPWSSIPSCLKGDSDVDREALLASRGFRLNATLVCFVHVSG